MEDELFDDIQNYLNTVSKEFTLITEPELERLILSLAETRGDEGFEEEEVMHIVRWAESTRVGHSMLEFVLNGTCDVDWKDGEVAIRITELGRKRHEDALGSN